MAAGSERYVPTASVTHFLTWLALAAPARFFDLASASQFFFASPSHFFKKLFMAAPTSFLSAACALQVVVCACAATVDSMNASASKTIRMIRPPENCSPCHLCAHLTALP